MKILILGGGGMVGQKLLNHLLTNPQYKDQINEIILHDIVQASTPQSDVKISTIVGDCSHNKEAEKLAHLKPDVIFHLASIVSGEAEQKFEKGWNINGHGIWYFLEHLRAQHEASNGAYRPRLIFTSSIAVFGGPFPDVIDDEFLSAPQTSYGAQKAMSELLITDYSRKGYIDGISLRLPTITVRPGKPNLAASSFFSGIIREPLNGVEAILPVSQSVRHWFASPRSAARSLAQAIMLDTERLEGRRALSLPGISCTVAEQLEALANVAGKEVTELVHEQHDKDIIRIVANWPQNFNPERAIKLGFTAEDSFEEIIRIYIEDDLKSPNA